MWGSACACPSLRKQSPSLSLAHVLWGLSPCPSWLASSLLPEQVAGVHSLSPCWEKAVGSSHAWACGKRCSPEVWEQGPALHGLRAALPASGPESPVWVLGSSGVRMKKRDAGGSGAVGYGVVFSFQAPITGLLRGVHLFFRRTSNTHSGSQHSSIS